MAFTPTFGLLQHKDVYVLYERQHRVAHWVAVILQETEFLASERHFIEAVVLLLHTSQRTPGPLRWKQEVEMEEALLTIASSDPLEYILLALTATLCSADLNV